jgi:hypothetical protein
VLINRENYRAQLPWAGSCLAVAVIFAVWYVWLARTLHRWPGGSSQYGLVAGTMAGGIIVFEFLLWPRKMVRAWRIGRAQTWMLAHIWLGLLCVPLTVLHAGFTWGGVLTTVLLVIFTVVILSGVFGLILQNLLPRTLLHNVPAETIYAQIEHVSARMAKDARARIALLCGVHEIALSDSLRSSSVPIVIGARGPIRGKVWRTEVMTQDLRHAEGLWREFESTIEPYLLKGSRSSSPLRRRVRANQWFTTLRETLDESARATIDQLEQLCEQRRQFDLQRRLHWWLHSWLIVHLPLSLVLLVLLLVHVYTAMKYW